MAGDGIEYDWGKGKHDFRRDNDGVPANLERNVKRALNTDETLTRERRFKFSRKARSYTRGYYELSNGLDLRALTHDEIERIVKRHKAHRSVSERCSFIVNL